MLIQRLILKRAARAWRKAPGAEVPTICVGNITVGGTGKTPHTEMILRLLQELRPEARLAVLSRGYKRKSKGYQQVMTDSTASFAGDEPLQIKRKFPEVKVSVDKNRVEGCRNLVSDGTDIIVLDDAFQYKKLHATLNIVPHFRGQSPPVREAQGPAFPHRRRRRGDSDQVPARDGRGREGGMAEDTPSGR